MQRWEYKVVKRERKAISGLLSSTPGDWDQDIVGLLPELGRDG